MDISLIGNKSGVFIDPVRCNAFVDYKNAENYADIDMDGVNHLAIRRDSNGRMYIFQASGYTYDRGIFCDLY